MNNDTQTLLIELGTEELPPKALKLLSDSFAKNVASEISKLGFAFSNVKTFGAPRRLAVALQDCERKQADKVVEKRGPAVKAAFDEQGQPTKAALGWARGNGIAVEQAERLVTDKGEWLLHKAHVSGQTLDDLLEKCLITAIKQLPIPKPMRWGDSKSEFIRPVHTLTVLYGADIINCSVLGLNANRVISGHRFHGASEIELEHADAYQDTLQKEYVLADYASRMQAIEHQLTKQADELGLEADYSTELLEEISSLVEWPVVLQAKFEDSFLEVPKEALIYTMKDDQKYVPLIDQQGKLSSTFLFVSNIESKDPSQVISGNEKVIRPRLSDAQFFFETDKKTSLKTKSAKLDQIVFQQDLGTITDKSNRVAGITQILGEMNQFDAQDMHDAAYAAKIAKADLVSNMVMEFPSVQGVMGYHYALHDGESESVATAIVEQYLPRFSKDGLPTTNAGVLLSLAEKLDTLVGIFGVNKIPKGDKDPFALRRAAIGILRIMAEFKINCDLKELILAVQQQFKCPLKNTNVVDNVVTFLLDRLQPYYADRGIASDVVSSVISVNSNYAISDIDLKIKAVKLFVASDSSHSLINANKRVANILNKNKVDLNTLSDIDEQLFEFDEEGNLFEAYLSIESLVETAAKNNQYSEVFSQLSSLKDPLDSFFDKVMIMTDDEAVKHNRISLVAKVRGLFLSVADISVLNIA